MAWLFGAPRDRVYFRDKELDASWSCSARKCRRIADLRTVCEKRAEYETVEDRGPGFLRLSFRKREIVDDFASFKTLGYELLPRDCRDPKVIAVARRPVAKYKVTWHQMTLDLTLHARERVSHLRGRLARELRVPSSNPAFFFGPSPVDDSVFVHDCPKHRVYFRVHKHRLVQVQKDAEVINIVFPTIGTVFDLIALLQARFYSPAPSQGKEPPTGEKPPEVERGPRLMRMTLSIHGRRLKSREIVSKVITAASESSKVIEGSEGNPLAADSARIWYKFPGWPARKNAVFPIRASMRYVQNVLAMSLNLSYRSIVLQHRVPLSDAELHGTVEAFLGGATKALVIVSTKITVTLNIHGGGTSRIPDIPISYRIFDLKAKLATEFDPLLVQVYKWGILQPDVTPLDGLGVVQDELKLDLRVRQHATCTVWFEGLNRQGKAIPFPFSVPSSVTFGDFIAQHLELSPFVTIRYQGERLAPKIRVR
jgi:hypothetical protein